jgi:hypothetical protein
MVAVATDAASPYRCDVANRGGNAVARRTSAADNTVIEVREGLSDVALGA